MSALREGMLLADNRRDRVVRLVARVNPMGLMASPVWVVRNTATGRRTVIREATLEGRRFHRVD